jgi:hypothetical protein
LITFIGQIKVKNQSRKSEILHLVWQITRKNPKNKSVQEAEVKKAKMGTEDLAEDREVCGEQEVQKWEPKEVPEAKVKKAKMGTVVPDEVPEVCGRATTIVALNEVREVFSTSKTPIAWSNPRCCCPG